MIDVQRAQEIAEKYYQEIYAYCYTLANYDDYAAEVITQEVFLLFQQKCDNLDDNFINRWLLAVAKNKAREFYRKKQKDSVLMSLDESLLEIEDKDLLTMFDENLINDEVIQKYIDIIVKTLTPKERELYRKIFEEKKLYKDIAEEMNISEAAVTSRARRLKNRIRALVKLMFTSVGQFIISLVF